MRERWPIIVGVVLALGIVAMCVICLLGSPLAMLIGSKETAEVSGMKPTVIPTLLGLTPTPSPTSTPTPQAVATGQLSLGESGVYEGMTITLVKYELTETRIGELVTNIPAEGGHHWLWLYARAENRGSKPAFRPTPLLFDVWHKDREVASICQEPYEGDPHQPPFNCGLYMKMQPGESCEGWLYVAPALPDDWALEDLVVSYGDMCDSEFRLWPPCLYWRLE